MSTDKPTPPLMTQQEHIADLRMGQRLSHRQGSVCLGACGFAIEG